MSAFRRQKEENHRSLASNFSSVRCCVARLRQAKAGGVDRDRTDDLKLAKLALSQLSYDPVFKSVPMIEGWWARVELNHRPHAYQACALTT